MIASSSSFCPHLERLSGIFFVCCMPRTPYWASDGKHSPVMETLATTHHALSPHPHVIVCSSFISPKDCIVLYLITMSLKWLLVPKNDVNQQFTTTTL